MKSVTTSSFGKRCTTRGGATLGRREWRTQPFSTLIRATSNHKLRMAEVVKPTSFQARIWERFQGALIEMDLHHPPTSEFHGNQLYHACGLIALQLLIATQFKMLAEDARSHGLRPLIPHVVRSVAKLTRSGGRHQLAFGKGNLKFDWLVQACALCTMPGSSSCTDDRSQLGACGDTPKLKPLLN